MSRRMYQSTADYAVIAVNPTLIILMLTALVHFLVLCAYSGEFTYRLMYILFLFILASTLIARISIEKGRAYAAMYALALAGATFIAINQFVALSGPLANLSFIFNTFLIVLIWFLADRITYDCTVIDDQVNSAGEGLLTAKGLFGSGQSTTKGQQAPAVNLDGTSVAVDENATDSRSLPSRRRGHKPGRWVLYLAIGALPLFGLGQLFLPDSDPVRANALRSLGIYLFATLALLVSTSFLGVRRYLRQRGAEMPAEVSVAWLAGGIVFTAVIILFCFLLPIPGRMLASAQLPQWLVSPEGLRSSRFGWGDEAVKDEQSSNSQISSQQSGSQQSGSQQSGSQQSGNQQSGNQQSGNQQSGNQQSGNQQSGNQQSGNQQSGNQQSGSQQSGNQQSGSQQSGNQQSGNQQSGNQQSGSQQSGSQQSGSQQSGNQQSGNQQSGSQQTGSQQSGSQQSGSQQSGNQQSGNQQSGNQQSGTQQSGSQQSGSQQSGSQQSGSQQSGNQQSGNQQSGNQQSGNQQSGNQQSGNQQSGDQQSSNQQSGNQQSNNQSSTGQSSTRDQSNQPQATTGSGEQPTSSWGSSFSNLLSWLPHVFKLVIYAVLIFVILLFLIKNWTEIKAWWQGILEYLRGEKASDDSQSAAASVQSAVRSLRPFASFTNPLNGAADASQAVVTTFQAFEAWGREQGVPRQEEETPTEYTDRMAAILGPASSAAQQVTLAYNRVVYGRRAASQKDLTAAAQLWQTMTTQIQRESAPPRLASASTR